MRFLFNVTVFILFSCNGNYATEKESYSIYDKIVISVPLKLKLTEFDEFWGGFSVDFKDSLNIGLLKVSGTIDLPKENKFNGRGNLNEIWKLENYKKNDYFTKVILSTIENDILTSCIEFSNMDTKIIEAVINYKGYKLTLLYQTDNCSNFETMRIILVRIINSITLYNESYADLIKLSNL